MPCLSGARQSQTFFLLPMPWLFLLFALLGLLTYVFIARQVSRATTTSVWLLWMVVMTPPLVITLWALRFGPQPMPPLLLLTLFFSCFWLYFALIQRGRHRSADPESPAAPGVLPLDQQPEPPPQLRPIDAEEEARLKTCFPWSVYFIQNLEYRPQAVICWGQLRGTPEVAYKAVQENVQREFGDRFLVLFQEGTQQKPVFAIVPNPQASPELRQLQQQFDRPSLGIGLGVVSFISTVWAGCEIVRQTIKPETLRWTDGLPYALAWMGFFLVREFSYYGMARRYAIPVTLPYFIPLPPLPQLPIGTIGAFIQLRAPVPNRRALFDVRGIGALLGLIFALALLTWGLFHSSVVPLTKAGTIFDFEALKPQYSLLLAVLSKWALGSRLTATSAILLHPVAFAGWLGVLFTAFNLMPVGQLDGGRIVHAVFGQRKGAIIGQITRFLLLLLSINQPHLLLWAVLLFFLPVMDEPALNDVTELDPLRDGMGLLALLALAAIVLPPPPLLLSWLGLA
jgi:membrane-associated protease RseP (regulator of RpoE activity)